MNNEKLKEFFNIVICLVIILAIGYSTGFLNDFSPKGFIKSFEKTSKVQKKYRHESVRNVAGFQPSYLPESFANAKYSLPVYNNMKNAGTKVVFYIYDDRTQDKNFHYGIQNYLARSSDKTQYSVYTYTTSTFKSLYSGMTGPSKICDSIEECNEQRQRAVEHAESENFLRNCGKTMCVINPNKLQYIRLKKRDVNEAYKMLNALRNWN